MNGCSRGANESMSENLVNSKTLPFGEDHGEHRECTLDALTLNEVSGAAAPVTPHTHLLGDPCPAHSPVADGTRDRAMSKYADVVLCRKQDWLPRTTCGFSHNTRRNEQQEPGLLSLLRKLLGASSLPTHAEGVHRMRRDALGVALVRQLLEMRMSQVLQTGGLRG